MKQKPSERIRDILAEIVLDDPENLPANNFIKAIIRTKQGII